LRSRQATELIGLLSNLFKKGLIEKSWQMTELIGLLSSLFKKGLIEKSWQMTELIGLLILCSKIDTVLNFPSKGYTGMVSVSIAMNVAVIGLYYQMNRSVNYVIVTC
jgi:hypothetical protein